MTIRPWLRKLDQGKQTRKLHANDTLLKMVEALRDPDKPYLDNDKLEALGIKVSQVELSGIKDTRLSKFFSPMPIQTWPASFDPDGDFRLIDPSWGRCQESIAIDYDLRNWINKPIDGKDGKVPNILELSGLHEISNLYGMSDWGFHEDLDAGPARYPWIVTATYEKEGKPHLIIQCRQSVKEDSDHVLRTEMLSLIVLMVWRLQNKLNAQHDIIPVLMISIRAKYACILTAHFDGKYLQVQRSGMFCPGKTPHSLKLLIRHLMSEPVGNTLEL